MRSISKLLTAFGLSVVLLISLFTVALAEDYAIPVVIGGKTYTITMTVEADEIVAITASNGVQVGDPQLVSAPAGSPAANRGANLRAGPGTTFAVVGAIKTGQALNPVGKNADGSWLKLDHGAWIAASLVNNSPSDLPVVQELPLAPAAATTAAPVVTSNEQEQATPTKASSSIVGIGQEVQGRGWRFKVAEVHKRKSVWLYNQSHVAMGNYLVVIIDAVNEQSGTDYFFRQIEPYLTDDAGHVYEWDSTATSYATWQYEGISTVFTDVNPGNFVRIVMVFDLSDDVGHLLLSTNLPAQVDLGNFGDMNVEDQR